jgi:DNA-binding Lrp family transcriptional regulator
MQRFERSLEQHSKIVEGHALAGESDYLLFISVADLNEFEAVHRTILAAKLPGVKSIKTDFLIRQVKPQKSDIRSVTKRNAIA